MFVTKTAPSRLTRVASATFKLGVIGSAFILLTGFNDGGCGGGEPPPPQDDDHVDCPPGSHTELVCEGYGYPGDPGYPAEPGDPGYPGDPESGPLTYPEPPPHDCGGCYEICVPDDICPPDHYEEWVCDDMGEPPPGDPGQPGGPMPLTFCLDPNGCAPEPNQCYPVCVPIDPCGPGWHEELDCGWGWGGGYGPEPTPWCDDESDPDCYGDPGAPPPPDECMPICVPDDVCGPDAHLELVCDEQGICLDPQGCPPGPEDCYETCVPNGPCPMGLEPSVICDEFDCWAECHPPL